MRTIRVVAVMSVLATLTLFVGTVPGSAADSFDLTAGPVTVSYTLDLRNAPNVPATGTQPNWWEDADWGLVGTVGLFGGGAGAQMLGFLSDTQPSANTTNLYPTYPDNDASLDMDDKFNMQRWPNPGTYSETMYDTPCAGASIGVVGAAIGSGDNYGVWFDRDGVDPWQDDDPLTPAPAGSAVPWGSQDGGTYNTDGVYEVVLTFAKAATPGYGFVCATVDGIPTGFYSGGWSSAGPNLYPYGLSFAATEQQLEEMEVVSSVGDPGIVISNLEVSGIPSFTRDQGDCPQDATFVSSTTAGPVSLPAVAGHKYEIDVSGTFYAGGTSTFDIQADAEYSQNAVQRAAGDPWTVAVRNYESYGEELLDLLVDGQIIDWGPYSPTHEYSMQKVATGGTIEFEFAIYDVFYPNNTGGLCVSIEDVSFSFEGFFSPIDNGMVNSAKAGQVVPVKWRLLDSNGDPVSDPASFVRISSTSGAGSCLGEPTDAIETYAGGSGLQYLGDGYWQFNWKTPKGYAGQCRTMTLELADGSTHTAEFQFK